MESLTVTLLGTWARDAACAPGRPNRPDPEDFYPEGEVDADHDARRVCRRCTVRPECLDWAIANKEQGIWAGTDERERRNIALRRQALERGVA